ncbi:signal peptidase I [Candidatus Aquarickettsia rohweri]|uniref:Signal peptidase I n=1 Tax=Candidatus Aquarickettsia rohweri TaxID=2602574 RepID=A0A3R9ZBG3_9RICK|nr:signal peptidase I [Candidatus Aquarickettsia rohweri]RST69964.1 signal peptidase I [Candidatus Aquarickettsia rohweri]
MDKSLTNFLRSIFSSKNIKELFNSLIFAFVFAFIFQTFIYQPFKIPSGSMKPGLQVGDYLFVEKFAYGYNNSSLSFMLNRFNLFSGTFMFNKPKRGDVIVFLLPTDRSMHYIKRLIGLPGDKIQIKDGLLYINEVPVKREFKGKKIIIEQNKVKYTKDIFEETLPNGVKYEIYMDHIRSSYHNNFDHNNTPVYTVPKGYYFFMGDNRDSSIDSRFIKKVGYVSEDNLLGKAKFLFWTSDFSVLDFITKLQTNRAFKTIQ